MIIMQCYSALHHFPMIDYAFNEMARVLKKGGQLFIADPTPNDNDTIGFADKYMRMKPDGHVKFYTQNEFFNLADNTGFRMNNIFKTEIRFPRKDASHYNTLICDADKSIVDGYNIRIIDDEIYITEQVLNLSFIKN